MSPSGSGAQPHRDEQDRKEDRRARRRVVRSGGAERRVEPCHASVTNSSDHIASPSGYGRLAARARAPACGEDADADQPTEDAEDQGHDVQPRSGRARPRRDVRPARRARAGAHEVVHAPVDRDDRRAAQRKRDEDDHPVLHGWYFSRQRETPAASRAWLMQRVRRLITAWVWRIWRWILRWYVGVLARRLGLGSLVRR